MRVGQLSLTERQRIVTRYEAGEKAKDLATAFKVDRGTVTSVLVEAGVRRPRSLTTDEITTATDLYLAGSSLAQVGRDLGRSAETVRQALLATGLAMRPPWARP